MVALICPIFDSLVNGTAGLQHDPIGLKVWQRQILTSFVSNSTVKFSITLYFIEGEDECTCMITLHIMLNLILLRYISEILSFKDLLYCHLL